MFIYGIVGYMGVIDMRKARHADYFWVVAVVWHGVLTAVEVRDNYLEARRRIRELKSSGYYDLQDDDLLIFKCKLNERDEAA